MKLKYLDYILGGLFILLFAWGLFGCNASKTTQQSDLSEVKKVDSTSEHKKSALNTSTTHEEEGGTETTTIMDNPVIVTDSAGKKTITATRIETKYITRYKSKTSQTLYYTTEELTITMKYDINKHEKVVITKKVTPKTFWWIWLLIGAGSLFAIQRLGPLLMARVGLV